LWIRLLAAAASAECLLSAAAALLDRRGLAAEAEECRWQAFRLRVNRRLRFSRGGA
jgi:hypothetical protein